MPAPSRKALVSSVKQTAIKVVKPRLSDRQWEGLRLLGGGEPKIGATPKPRPTLTTLAKKFKTDKWGVHRYTPRYEQHLASLRDEPFTLLEIGIGGFAREGQGGASLRMWKEFFPQAQIVGLDIQDKSFVDEERIRTYQGSQVDEEVLRRIFAENEGIQVVIDDGSHRPHHIRETFRVLFPLLPEGGIYCIEDTQTSYWPEFAGSEDRQDRNTTMALVKDLVDGLNYEEFVDEDYEPTYTDLNVVGVHCYHNLVVIEKGRNEEGTNKLRALGKRYLQRRLDAEARAAAEQAAATGQGGQSEQDAADGAAQS